MMINAFRTILVCLAAVSLAALQVSAHADTPSQGPSAGPSNILRVTAKHPDGDGTDDHLIFELSDHEIDAGWTTVKFRNDSRSTHFAYMVKVPEEQADMTRDEYSDAVNLAFQDAWDPYFAGEIDVEGFFDQLFAGLPGWYFEAIPSGGPGFLSGGEMSQATMDLRPGTYFIECYVLNSEGVFHNTSGMVEKLVVTENDSGAPEPEGDLKVSVSLTDGITFEEKNIQPGRKSFEVVFEDNDVYGHGLGHDVNLVRLGDTTVSEINGWMNYLDVGADGFYADRGALVSDSENPGPQTFLGGVQDVFPDASAGEEFPQTAYFEAVLKPGHYALVAEVPNPMQPDPENTEMTLLHEFSVTPGAGLTGGWHDPETDGQGWNFVATPTGVIGYFYGYSDTGQPLWLITEETIDGVTPGEPLTVQLLQGEGGSFSNPVHPAELTSWGEATLTFENCEEATAEISGTDGVETQELVRISDIPGMPDCAL